MKAYYEYEDGTFWAIRTEGNSCFTANGSKYCDLYLDIMLDADSVEEGLIPQHAAKLSFESEEAAEAAALKMIEKNSAGALAQDAEFWRSAIEINARLLFFVPDPYKTEELCALAAARNGRALEYVPAQMKSYKLCRKAVFNNGCTLQYVDDDLKTEELCEMAVKSRARA